MYELNLSNNAISDISPLSGACVDTMILSNNEIKNIDRFEGATIEWLVLDGNQLGDEDIQKLSNANTVYYL